MNQTTHRLVAGLLTWACVCGDAMAGPDLRAFIGIEIGRPREPAIFGADEVEAALQARGYEIGDPDAGVLVHFWPMSAKHLDIYASIGAPAPADVGTEGFSLRVFRDASQPKKPLEFVIFSRDAGGAMYGGLELAEQISTAGIEGVTDTDRNPHMRMRGTKFNIPLDLRTPSYSDMSDSAQANIETVWDFEFWKAYLDKLARDRYNFVSLWNLHPFRCPNFPTSRSTTCGARRSSSKRTIPPAPSTS
jgi:hypothetical protein